MEILSLAMETESNNRVAINLADPELELVDPTPNVHTLFIHFDKLFFWTKLASRAVVRWSKRMYSCAGICSYEGRGGLCDIALSEPLLKLRPRKDLVETLLHEMIHAFLFVTNRDQDRDGHGPNFQAHMHRINKFAGLNISIYHDFHDEVKLYLTHWWRCNGPCQIRRPHFGIVRRSCNRPPGPSDFWYEDHKRKCGGTFIKIKEPEKKKPAGKKDTENTKKNVTSNGDITKYINNNTKNIDNNSVTKKPVLQDSSNIKSNTRTKTNGPSTLVVGKKGVVFNPTVPKPVSKPAPKPEIPVFTGTGHTLSNNTHVSDSRNVTETVRNIWVNKELPKMNNIPAKRVNTGNGIKPPGKVQSNPNKHKADPNDVLSPPAKVKKIDDYFKASSVLKDLYGDDIKLTQNHDSTKLVAVKVNLVDCPICSAKVDSKEINRHLDECLNKDVIEKLSKDNQIVQESQGNTDIKQMVGDIQPIPAFKGKEENTNNNTVDISDLNDFFSFEIYENKNRRKTESQATLQNVDMDKVKSLVKQTKNNMNVTTDNITTANVQKPSLQNARKSDHFVSKDRGDGIKIEKDVDTNEVKIKVEPGVSNIEPKASTSKDPEASGQICPCCGKKSDIPIDEHLDECLVFFNNNTTIPEEGVNTSMNSTIVIDDDEADIFDETMTLNATGTKTPCPCCMKMVEEVLMNEHLDVCLGLG